MSCLPMSEPLDPHWQNEERPVRVTVRTQAASHTAAAQPCVQSDMVSVSRRPAAVAGILLSGGVLLSLYGASDLFLGQTLPESTSDAVVTITTKGFEPSMVRVQPGKSITWKNNGDIPHILTSDTLETTDGLLDTSPIFTGSTLTVQISESAKTGTYTYESLTSSFSGAVLVTADDAQAGGTVSSAVSSVQQPVIPTTAVSSSSAAAIVSSVSSSSAAPQNTWTAPSSRAAAGDSPFPAQVNAPQVPVIPVTPTGLVPRNPYALNRTGNPAPIEPATVAGQRSSVRSGSSSLHAGAPIKEHKPVSQPQTGTGEWLVALVGLVSLALVTKKAFAEQAWTERR